METRSSDAYDTPARVSAYDHDMQIMHPNRGKMIEVALDLLPLSPDRKFRALDLGVGTGIFSAELLSRHPGAELVAVDGAEAMVELARERLGDLNPQVSFLVSDFRDLDSRLPRHEGFDAVISSFALHHLSRDEKEAVVKICVDRLHPGGWFLNADLIVAETAELEERIQALRVAGIVGRAPEEDQRFATALLTRQFLDELEEGEGDRPLTLREDLACLEGAGLKSVAVAWLEYREAVTVGIKPETA